MKSIRCIHCGLINWADAETCKRCGNPPHDSARGESAGWTPGGGDAAYGATYGAGYGAGYGDGKKRKGLAVASLVLGILSLMTFSLLGVGALTALIMGIVAAVRASKNPQVYGGRGLAVGGIVTSVFSLVMIVPLMIIAAIAIPNLLASRRAANEASAIYSVRQIVGAEATYSSTEGAGEFGSMEDLARTGLVNANLAAGVQSGYRFVLVATSDTCSVTAVPVEYGRTGTRSFYATCASEEIHYADKAGLAADSDDPVVGESGHGSERRSFDTGYPGQSASPRAPRTRY